MKRKSMIDKSDRNLSSMLILVTTFLIMIGATVLFFSLEADFSNFRTKRLSTTIGTIFLYIATGVLLYKALFFIYTLFCYFRYKAIPSVSDGELPTCTVIVPAYNEGKQVYETLRSLANSDYPKNKMQLIAIDDGSKDDTWFWLQEAKKYLGDRVTIYQQPKNMGKRHALYRGFKTGNGEVFVTVDSDSIVVGDKIGRAHV